MAEVKLPDGTIVRGNALAARCSTDRWRDFGLYLDPAWEPSWPAVVIDWPDYGLPVSPQNAYQHIVEAFERARSGERIEIGCRGGLGRTGTVLACFAVLAGYGPRAAIEWVRSDYDRMAVETQEQEQWVHWFASQVKQDARCQ